MHQHTLHVVVLAKLDALVAAHLQIDGVGNLAVGADHLVKGVVVEAEGVGVDGGDHVDAAGLQAGAGGAEIRPAGDALEHDTVLLLAAEGGDAVLVVVLILLQQRLHGVGGGGLAASRDHDGHVVQQVEAVEGRGHVLGAAGGRQPCAAGAAGEAGDLLELLVRPLFAGDLLQLLHGIPELAGDVGHLRVGHLVVGVEGNVQQDHGDVQLARQILVPLDHAGADVAAAQQHVGHGHVLLGTGLQLGVGQGHAGVGAYIVGVALGLRHLAHSRACAAGGDAGGLVLGVHGGDAHGLGDLHGEVAGHPCYLLAPLLGFDGVHVGVRRDLAQLVLGGVGIHRLRSLLHFFCHFSSSSFLYAKISILLILAAYMPTAPRRWRRSTAPEGQR